MLSYQFVAGLSEIKTRLRTHNNLKKSLVDLQLWFSFEVGVLFVHDFHDHEKCLVLAEYNNLKREWRILFRGKAYGRQVIAYVIGQNRPEEIASGFNDLFKLFGYS